MTETISKPAAAFLALLLALPGLLTAGGSDDAAGGGVLLWLKAGSFDPLASPPSIPSGLTLGESQGYFIVQFNGPIGESERLLLEAFGEVVGYLPDHALVLRSERATSRELRGLTGVRWSGPYEPGYKLSPSLERCAGTKPLNVLPFAGASTATLALRKVMAERSGCGPALPARGGEPRGRGETGVPSRCSVDRGVPPARAGELQRGQNY